MFNDVTSNHPISSEKPSFNNYLFFISAETVSILGSEIIDFVLIWWITIVTQSALYLSLASFIAFGVQIVLSPIAGVYVDRWNRKIVIILSDLGQAIVLLYLVFKFTLGDAVVGDVLILMLILNIFLSFQLPAITAIVPLMVEEKNVNKVNSINYFSNVFAKVVGAPLGALLMEFFSIASLLWFDIITFLFAVSIIIFITIPTHLKVRSIDRDNSKAKSSFKRDFKDGLSIIRGKGMLGFFFVFPITNFFETPRSILLPLLISYTYKGNAFTFALIISSFQLTVSIITIFLGWKNPLGEKNPAKVVLFGILTIFFGSILLVVPNNGSLGVLIIIPLIGMILMGIGSPAVNITMNNLYYKVFPSESLGRVKGTSTSASLSMIPFATLLTGFMTFYFGNNIIRIFIFISSFMGCFALLIIWFFTDLKNIKGQISKGFERS